MSPSYTLLAVIVVDLLATAGDITISWTSPIYPKLYSNDSTVNPLGRQITPDEDALLGSLLNLGAVIGSFPFAYVAEKYGRKIGLLSIAAPHVISFLMLAYAGNIYLFYVARLLAGLALGGGYTLLPTYIAEISRDDNRGAMSLSMNMFWAFGNFIPYAIGPYMSVKWFNIVLATIPAGFFVLFLILGPESPHYLLQTNQVEKAEETLMLLRSGDLIQVKKEMSEMRQHLEMDEEGKLSDIFVDKYLRKPFVICLLLICTQELSGFCAIAYHLQTIFETARTNLRADISALIVGLAILVTSVLAPALVDKIGRRFLIIASCFGMCVAHLCIGIFFYLQEYDHWIHRYLRWLPISSLIFYIFSFNLGICCVPWTLVSELFPSKVKRVTSSSASIMCWITSFITTATFNAMNGSIGTYGTFWSFGGFCFVCGLVSIVWVPETMGKSFKEIQVMLRYGSVLKLRKKSGVEVEMLDQD